METITRNKGTFGVIIIFLVGMMVYKIFSPEAEVPIQNKPIGADLIKLADDLNKANLNPDLFNKKMYKLLSDFSASIPSQPLGRSNPFDAIGR